MQVTLDSAPDPQRYEAWNVKSDAEKVISEEKSKIVQKVPYHFNAPVEDLSLLPGRLRCDCA